MWTAANRTTFAPENNPEPVTTLYLAQAGPTRYFALLSPDPVEDETDEVRLFVDTNRNQGDPDSADRLYVIQRNGTAVVQPGVGTNGDLLTWEANASEVVTVGVEEAEGGYWIVELGIDTGAIPTLANPFAFMLQITDSVTVFTWPEEADPFVTADWQAVANPVCP